MNSKNCFNTSASSLSHEEFSALMQPFFLPEIPSPSMVVAVSGGCDSMALALLTQHWATERGSKVIALTVDHGLREESKQEAETVKKWLAQYGIEHHSLYWEGEKPVTNIQEKARNKRYELLTSWCKEKGIDYLLTAHHQDDQAETLLLRLARGSGVDGLCAIPAKSYHSGVTILRPLLDTPKVHLQEFLLANNQPWIEDPSNQNPVFARNAMRMALDTYTDAALISKRLSDTAKHMARVRDYLEGQVAEAMTAYVVIHPEGHATLDHNGFCALHDEIALRLLSKLLSTVSGNTKKPRFSHITKLLQAMKRGNVATLHGCKISRNKAGDTFLFHPEHTIQPVIVGSK